MAEVTALFFDVGGVLLTDGFDRKRRGEVCRTFGLDPQLFEERHATVVDGFERGKISLEDYLSVTLAGSREGFPRDGFRRTLLDSSSAHEGALATARKLSQTGTYTLATLNNESRELNDLRIETFGLRKIFPLFFSSCYTGLRKPDLAAFRLALEVTQHEPEECLFLDDRPENVAAAASVGMHTLLVRDPERLGEDLSGMGIKFT